MVDEVRELGMEVVTVVSVSMRIFNKGRSGLAGLVM
jgi:hypothetical protein